MFLEKKQLAQEKALLIAIEKKLNKRALTLSEKRPWCSSSCKWSGDRRNGLADSQIK